MLSAVRSHDSDAGRIPQIVTRFAVMLGLLLVLCPLTGIRHALAQENPAVDLANRQAEAFFSAWEAARTGNRDEFHRLKAGLQDYLLYPYLQYEDLRYRRATVATEEMAAFLQSHQDWPFTAPLRKSWLLTLGKEGRWDALLRYAGDSGDTEIQCYLARARIGRGLTDGLMPLAQKLWTVGKSQPDACDPVFSWLRKNHGISSDLAWERIRLAMEARQPRLTLYLERYVDAGDQVWVSRWQEQERGGYYRLNQARQWSDQDKGRTIARFGLRHLARSDADRSAKIYEGLAGHFSWTDDDRGGILREIALWSAVEGAADTAQRMRAVPEPYRDDKLYEWWVRYELARENWAEVVLVIAGMSGELKSDPRWRYWDARARLQVGDSDYPLELLRELSLDASYYGFLSADLLDLPYAICPQEPTVTAAEVDSLGRQPGFRRALELHRLGLRNWSRSEWQLAVSRLDRDGLRRAAALAVEHDWPDMAIFALGNSGDLRWYDWRFPTAYSALVGPYAQSTNLDASWVLGLMRSESAMATDARSSAGALGLMQIMPDTAQRLAKRHGIPYGGSQTLVQPEENIQLGTAYLRDLLDRFGENPVLATGAYNAGPHAVDRWLKNPSTVDPTIWIETLPYFETRDYIPRVLAFSAIYDWRRQQPVKRISARMPELKSGKMGGSVAGSATAAVVCPAPG
jgi:soluble lytic murein transglycosylase